MMRKFLLFFIIGSVLWGCSAPTPVLSPTVELTQTLPPTQTPTPRPEFSPTPEPEPTETWQAYEHIDFLSLEYPSDWQAVTFDCCSNLIEFTPGADNANLTDSIRISIYTDFYGTNPKNWEPNEAGYEVIWSRPIEIPGASGIEFVWGSLESEEPPQLMAIVSSEKYQTEIRLETAFYPEQFEELRKATTENQIAELISFSFPVFEHILNSMEIIKK